MTKNNNQSDKIVEELTEIFGSTDPSFEVISDLDPEIAEAFIELNDATKKRGALEPRYRALIKLALSATPTHLKPHFTRLHIAEALKLGATKEEICEVLEITSVLGIHGFIPGTFMVLDIFGGLEKISENLGSDAAHRANQAMKIFKTERGEVGDVWETNCLLAPDFVAAYAKYSGVPWKTTALPGKIKELLYVTIDLSPTHVDIGGATHHAKVAVDKFGATFDEIMEVLEIIGMVGFQTHMMALPILKEELERVQEI